MELFIKGNEVKRADEIVVCLNGISYYSPTIEQIIEAGWKLYEPQKAYELTPEEVLQDTKERKKRIIYKFDHSEDDVNKFFYQGHKMWLSREERMVLGDRFERELAEGRERTQFIYQGLSVNVTPAQGLEIVNKVKSYADKCFDVTHQHYADVDGLTSVEEVEAYDYKQGYPEVLHL